MIAGFRNKKTEDLFLKREGRGFPPDIVDRARRKLAALHAAVRLDDLRVPPSNRLELLRGARSGQYSIRINDQWRICFRWDDGQCVDVEVCDYH